MKIENKERRVINIDKEEFDIIKIYCNDNNIKMSKWIALVALQSILMSLKSFKDNPFTDTNIILKDYMTLSTYLRKPPELYKEYINRIHKSLGLPNEELKGEK